MSGWPRGRALVFATACSVAWLGAAAIGGCARTAPDEGSPTPTHDDVRTLRGWQSGTRLRAQLISFGATPRFAGWFDTQRNEPCAFDRFVPAGEPHRCLPIEASGFFSSGYGSYFRTQHCDVPVALAAACNAKYLRWYPTNTCEAASRIFRPRGVVPASTVWTKLSDGTCAPVGSLANQPESFCELGDELPLDAFAAAHEEHEVRDPGVGAWVLAGDDGSREVIGAWDEAHDWPARASTETEDGVLRFVPARAAYDFSSLGSFGHGGAAATEPSCHRPAAEKDATSALCPVDAVLSYLADPAGCDPMQERWLHAGERLSRIWYVDGAGTCQPWDVPEGSSELFYSFEDYIPPDRLTRAKELVVGDGGVSPVFTAAARDDAEPVDATPDWYDHAHGARCTARPLPDGSTRCLPEDEAGYAFRDPACTLPVVKAVPAPFCGPPRDPPMRLTVSGLTSGFHPKNGEVHVFEVGPKWDGALYLRGTDGGCTAPGFDIGGPYYEVGAEIDLATYPAATVQRE